MDKRIFACVFALVLTLSATSARAQSTEHESLVAPMIVFAAGSVLDNATTNVVMHTPFGVEKNPMWHWTHNDPVAINIASGLTDALTLVLAKKLDAKHHKAVRWSLYGLGALRLGQGVHNIRVYQQRPMVGPNTFKIVPAR